MGIRFKRCVAQCHGWGVDQRCSSIAVSLVSDHAVYRLSMIAHLAPSLGHVDVGCAPLIRITHRCRQPLASVGLLSTMFNSIDHVFSLSPLSTQMKIPGRTRPGLSRIMQFGSGQGVGEGRRTASDGRTTKGVIEGVSYDPETLAKTLLLQLHRNGQPPGDQWGRALRPIPQRARKC